MADYNKLLQVPRGTKARLEQIKLDLLVNTLVYATDTKELGIKLSDGNIEYFMNATDINAKVDPNAMSYFDYAGRIYGDKYSLLPNAWQDMKEVDGAEIERESTFETQYGTLQYPNGEDNGVIIPNNVTSIGDWAFSGWTSNNQPLVIPSSVISIGYVAFYNWSSNNQPLVIPNSVASIGGSAFRDWKANTHPLIILIPGSVTSIDSNAFNGWSKVPYVEIYATTPPTLVNANAFSNQNNAPIYVPDGSVDDYKNATNWVDLADRIFPISDRPDEVDGKIIAHNTNSEAHQDIRGDIQTIEQSINGLENNKVDKVAGKGLSTNDYTTTEKNKLAGIAPGAEVNVQSDWNESDDTKDSYIQNKPTIPTVPTNVSSFTNDAGYLTSHQSLASYYTKTEIDTMIGDIESALDAILGV